MVRGPLDRGAVRHPAPPVTFLHSGPRHHRGRPGKHPTRRTSRHAHTGSSDHTRADRPATRKDRRSHPARRAPQVIPATDRGAGRRRRTPTRALLLRRLRPRVASPLCRHPRSLALPRLPEERPEGKHRAQPRQFTHRLVFASHVPLLAARPWLAACSALLGLACVARSTHAFPFLPSAVRLSSVGSTARRPAQPRKEPVRRQIRARCPR